MKFLIWAIFFCSIIAAVILFAGREEEGRWYDCRLAEFHPDYPKEVKDACRKMMREHHKNYKSNNLVI